jgi:hypothetical protein
MDQTDLGLILSATALAVSLGIGPTAAALIAGYLASRLARTQRPRR